MNKYRLISGIVLVIIIILMSGYVYMNKDTIFTRVVEYTYSDGCTETFVNENLTSPKCIHGRYLQEEALNKTMSPIVYDGADFNLSI